MSTVTDLKIQILETSILQNLRTLTRLQDEARTEIARIENDLARDVKTFEKSVFEAATELEAIAVTKRNKATAELSSTASAKWYMSAQRVVELVPIDLVVHELRKLGLVRTLLRKKITYAVNKVAAKDRAALLKKKGVKSLQILDERKLMCLSFSESELTVIKDLESGEWHISRPPKRQPKLIQGSS